LSDMQRTNPLAYEPINKLLLSYAIPGIIAMLVNSLYNIVDQIFIGHSSAGYLGNASTTIIFPLINFGLAVALLFGQGCAAYISLKLGADEAQDVNRAFGSMLTALTVCGVLYSVLCAIFMEPVLTALGATDAIMGYCKDYGYIILIGQPLVILTIGMGNVTRADGSPAFIMNRMLIGAGINVVLDPIFIFALDMGVAGAAIATVISQAVAFVLSVLYFVKASHYVKFEKGIFWPDFPLLGRLAMLGASGFATQTAVSLVNLIMNNMLRHYGALSVYGSEVPISAMGIVLKVGAIMIAVLVGISQGAQPILGFNYGARNYKRVKQTYFTSIKAGITFSVACWLMFMIFPRYLILLFGDNTPLFVEFGVLCYRRYLGLMCVAGFQIVSANYFQAVGHPVKAIFLTLSRQFIFLIPIMFAFGALFGIDGILFSGMAADALACIVTGTTIVLEIRRLDRLIGSGGRAEASLA